ncbi:hypothetical protein L6164_007194 [Bauhinia variegata]|uniref:Uncharacterized protein n=1 Tax=Bauhinia variegata TaxID=167791 RepID=A0ACB9PXB6_BAUVA|nr:hypothetical protein L6164_007194 [Bauhinia variegata]
MKTHAQVKTRRPTATRVNSQQVIFELKHKVVLALNKLADRDTHQIGADELEKTAQTLTPDGISPFLSCILDTDSEQKSTVRKECIRLMGTMARFHEGLILPHLPKMVANIVKRLRDPDTIVRDVCVETLGVLANKLVNCVNESDKVFVILVRPLFDALGEQNKQVQLGSAFCLARIIDNTNDPPVSVLHRMLIRTVKLLKNPHFMAKPAIVELNRSIIQAGGAPTQNILFTAITSIQEALKDTDWTTRKAASVALGEIGLSGGSFLGGLRASCIHSLEGCRFDKVKPVRDAVLQALKYWRSLPAPNTPEPSETGSSLKENVYGGDSADVSSTTESGRRDGKFQEGAINIKSTKSRVPLSVRKSCQNYMENPHHPKPVDWHVEIAIPKTHDVADFQNGESEGGSVTKALEGMSTDVTSMHDIAYDYVTMDEKQECSSVSNLATDNFETKFLTVSNDCFINNGLLKPIGRSQRFGGEELICDEQMYSVKMQNHRSSESTVTVSSSLTTHGCCVQLTNEIVRIQKQLSDIETKQANLMDQLQVFTSGIMDTLSTIQSRVVGLEHVLDRLMKDSVLGGRYSCSDNSKSFEQSQIMASPRLSMCTPRSSVDSHNRQPSASVKSSDIWEKKAFARCHLRNPAREIGDIRKNSNTKVTRNFTEKDTLNSSGHNTHSGGFTFIQSKKNGVFSPTSRVNASNGCSESNSSHWKRVKGLLCEGDLDSAYFEALCSNDELILVELLHKTGPVLECLSVKTVDDLLSTLATYLLEGRFLKTIIPWLQQVVDLSTTHGPDCIALSEKAREQLLSAVQEAGNLKFFSPAERRSAAQLSMKLHHIWGTLGNSFRGE